MTTTSGTRQVVFWQCRPIVRCAAGPTLWPRYEVAFDRAMLDQEAPAERALLRGLLEALRPELGERLSPSQWKVLRDACR